MSGLKVVTEFGDLGIVSANRLVRRCLLAYTPNKRYPKSRLDGIYRIAVDDAARPAEGS